MDSFRLTVEGGQPAFPQGPPQWPIADDAVVESVNLSLQSGQWGKYDGNLTQQLQADLESQFQSNHSLLCSSGTISVELALRGVGIKAGDEVILAAYDFSGNFRCIEVIGAIPVLVDVVENGWVMDADLIAAAISPKTKAVVVSHLHGQTAEVEAICKIAAEHGLKIVEDVCQSPGGNIEGKNLGSFGDVATYSFGGSKLLSAGRGGAILSNDPGIIQRAKIFAHRGNDAFPLSQIQAALLMPQLKQLAPRNIHRQKSANKISTAINELDGLTSLAIPEDDQAKEINSLGAYYKLPVMIDESFPADRAHFLSLIQAQGVAMDVGFRGFLKRSSRRCRTVGELPNATRAASQTMLLHHPILLAAEEEVELLIAVICRCHQYLRNE